MSSEKICKWCGGELPKRRRKYCCDEHAHLYYIHYIFPLWWSSARAAALLRAGNRCEHIDENGVRCDRRGKLEVHHIEPLGEYESYHLSPKNVLSNLIVLCRPHHEDAHRKAPKVKSPPKEQMAMELKI